MEVLRSGDIFSSTTSLASNASTITHRHFMRAKIVESIFTHATNSSACDWHQGSVDLQPLSDVSACVRIQLWFKAYFLVKRLLVDAGITTHNSSINSHRESLTLKQKRSKGKEWNKAKILQRTLQIFLLTHFKAVLRDKQQLLHWRSEFIRWIIDDVVEDSLNRSLRLQAASRLSKCAFFMSDSNSNNSSSGFNLPAFDELYGANGGQNSMDGSSDSIHGGYAMHSNFRYF